MKKFFFPLVVSFSAAAALSPVDFFEMRTKTAGELRGLKEKVERFAPHPIVIMDRDRFHMNSAIHGLGLQEGDSYPEKSELARQFFKNELGRDLIPSLAWLFYKEIHSEVEQALPHGHTGSKFWIGNDQSGNYCVLYPGRRDLDNDRLTRHIVDYSQNSYGTLHGHALKPVLTYDEHIKLTDYHEAAHCLDNRYMMDYMKGKVAEGPAFFDNRARLELKAETLGILLMVKFEGATDLAQRRSQERYLDSWFRGRTLARSAMDQMNAQAGATYAFGPALEALQKEIDARGAESIKEMTVPDLIALSEELVEKNVMSSEQRQFLVEAFIDPKKAHESVQSASFVDGYFDKVSTALSALTGGELSFEKIKNTILQESPGNGEHLDFPELEVASGEEKENRVAELARKIEEQRKNTSIEDSAGAYSRILDGLTATVRSGNEQERLEALRDRRLLPEAMKRLLHQK